MLSGLQTAATLILLGLAAWLHRCQRRHFVSTLLMFAGSFLALLLLLLYYVADYFTASGINEAVIYHLSYGFGDAGFLDYAGLAAVAVPTLLITAILLGWLYFRPRAHIHVPGMMCGIPATLASLALVSLALLINPASADLYKLLAPASSAGLALDESTAMHNAQAIEAEFERHYKQPKLTRLRDKPHNLVFIYAESLERNYFDERLFPGLMTNLRRLEEDALSFTNIGQTYGTGWTIAGMVASQCGIPLATPSHGNSMSGVERFLPAATCLGDLLKDQGYHLAYRGGASLKFAGKGPFYATHQFDDIAGRNELSSTLPDPTYLSAWGLYDDTLLDLAFEKYVDLSRSQSRFGLFLLTLDTHHPNGHLARECSGLHYADGSNPMLNAVYCSDQLLSNFISKMRASPWGEKTVIALMSDHLAMKNAASEILEQAPRRNTLMVWAPEVRAGTRIATTGSTLDVASTLLPLIGYQGKVGLGTDLLAQTPQEAHQAAFIRDRLSAWAAPLGQFWDFPRITKQMDIDVASRRFTIDHQEFRIPSVVLINKDLQTTIQFPYVTSAIELAKRAPRDHGFLLFTECSTRDPLLSQEELCLFAGKNGEFRTQLILRDRMTLPAKAILHMTGLLL